METTLCDLTAERNAVRSSCCGFLGEATLTDSAVIILFAGMLGASDMFAMITTSMLPLFNGLFVIPMAWLATKVGKRKLNLASCLLAAGAYFVAVSAPFWGSLAVPVLIGSIVLFAFFLTGFIASWFPLLDSFLPSDRRAAFFGRMRFSHQVAAVTFLFLAGLFIGDHPPLWKLQLLLLVGAVAFCGRSIFVARLPVPPDEQERIAGFGHGILDVLRNKPLMGFSIYLFMLSLASFSTIPLVLLTLKRQWGAPDSVTMILSSVALAGMLLGYLLAQQAIRRFGVRGMILGIHATFVLVNLALAFLDGSNPAGYIAVGVLLGVDGMMIALASVVTSSEMMALAAKGNKTFGMAVSGALTYGGAGGARLLSSLLLGSGLLAESWSLHGREMTRYQTLFLMYALFVAVTAILLPLVPAILAEVPVHTPTSCDPRMIPATPSTANAKEPVAGAA
jgi:MFS family permease